MGEHMCEKSYNSIQDRIGPRLFTPSIIHRTANIHNDFAVPVLKSILANQQGIIDKQGKIINDHEREIQDLKTSLSEIRHLLQGRQFMNRSVSFEQDLELDTVHITN